MDKRIFMLIKKGNLHTRRDKREGFLFRHSRLARKAAGLYSHGMNRPPGLPCGGSGCMPPEPP
ncbi:hypothetical protein P7H02_15455, partial [Paenibacillus larvae]|uniref:hypothetical protein n=2 Tax=Paenibacillus larvae TaxID=1464 RepID=UPI00288E9D87